MHEPNTNGLGTRERIKKKSIVKKKIGKKTIIKACIFNSTPAYLAFRFRFLYCRSSFIR